MIKVPNLLKGFSLIETVMALGIFAFCIVVIMGLMPVGLRAARSVAEEGNVVNIAESIFGGWQMQSAKSVPLTIPTMVSNLPPINSSVNGAQSFYFDVLGRQVAEPQQASLRMDYINQVNSNVAWVTLDFFWPANAPTNVAQRRTFNSSFQIEP